MRCVTGVAITEFSNTEGETYKTCTQFVCVCGKIVLTPLLDELLDKVYTLAG